MLTRQDIAKGVAITMRAYPTAAAKLTPRDQQGMIDAWLPLLEDLDLELFQRALARCLQTSIYVPSVAEIRRAAADLSAPPTDAGLQQWGVVLAAIRRVGVHRPAPPFEDPITASCVRSLGWTELCGSENATSDRARFIEAYNALAAAAKRERAVSPALQAGAAEPLQLVGDAVKRIGDGG